MRSYEAGARIGFGMVMVASIAALGRVVGVASPWFAVIASFCILGLLDLALPFVTPRMPRFLRELRAWEVRGNLYRAIRVPAFGELLRRTPLRLLNRRAYMAALHRDLIAVRTHLENAESAHFWGMVATIPYLVVATSRSWWGAVISVVCFNLIVNVYPILHLRWARARLNDVLGEHRRRHPIRSAAEHQT